MLNNLIEIILHIPVAKYDTGDFRKFFTEDLQHLNTVDFLHPAISDDGIKRSGVQQLQGLTERRGCIYPDIVVTFHETLAGIQEDLIVVDVEDRDHSNPLQQIKILIYLHTAVYPYNFPGAFRVNT